MATLKEILEALDDKLLGADTPEGAIAAYHHRHYYVNLTLTVEKFLELFNRHFIGWYFSYAEFVRELLGDENKGRAGYFEVPENLKEFINYNRVWDELSAHSGLYWSDGALSSERSGRYIFSKGEWNE